MGGFATARFTTPEEVATLITLLASERSANVTGANYVIDGGRIKTTLARAIASRGTGTGARWRSKSLLVLLDRVGPASRSVVWVKPELLPSPALAQQVPAAIELDLHGPQALPVCLESIGVRTVGLLAAT
jgi:Enoyl-(Acyl carrier protein) reductase